MKDDRVCAQLFCFDAGSGYCVSYRPAAEGSRCGDGYVRLSCFLNTTLEGCKAQLGDHYFLLLLCCSLSSLLAGHWTVSDVTKQEMALTQLSYSGFKLLAA